MREDITPEIAREWRSKHGMRQEDIAAKVGVTRANYAFWEVGKKGLNHTSLVALRKLVHGENNWAALMADRLRLLADFLESDFSEEARVEELASSVKAIYDRLDEIRRKVKSE